jgi:hypothetical protein
MIPRGFLGVESADINTPNMPIDQPASDSDGNDFAWTRFVAPRGIAVTIDDHGFLLHPRREWDRNSDLKRIADLAAYSVVVILGVPGIGKSNSLSSEYRRVIGTEVDAESALWFDLSAFGTDGHLVESIFQNANFFAARSAGEKLVLFLDSVDECQLSVKTIAQLLGNELRTRFWPQLQVRISCRSAIWPTVLERALIETWTKEDVVIVELQPLQRGDAESAARAVGVDAQAYMAAVERSRVGSFAARPITLLFLLNLYSRTQTLPDQRRDLYGQGLRTLVDEQSESRRASGHAGRLTIKNRIDLAEAIAAISVYCNRTQTWTGADSQCPEGCISIDQLADAAASLGLQFNCPNREAVLEVLDSGLFSGAMRNRVAWAHESYREYLAAHFLAEKCHDRRQIVSLIVNVRDPQRKVAPQLFGTVGWLYEFSPEVRCYINTQQPELILQSDLDIDPDVPREPLISAIMALAADGRFFDVDWSSRHRYRKLAFDGLHRVLSPYIRNPKLNVVARRIAIDILEECQDARAMCDLIALVSDPSEFADIREHAAFGIARMNEPQAFDCLRNIVMDPVAMAATDDLIGIALAALWPKHLSTKELLERVHTPKHEQHFGAYRRFIGGQLPEQIDTVDLIPAVEWLGATASERPDFALHPLQRSILRRALASCESVEVRHVLTHALWRHMVVYSQIFERSSAKEETWEVLPATARHDLLLELANIAGTAENGAATLAISRLGIVRTTDFDFLLTQYLQYRSEPLGSTLKELLTRIVSYYPTEHQFNTILNLCGHYAVNRDADLAHAFGWIVDPIAIDSPTADSARDMLRHRKALADRAAPIKLDPPPSVRVQTALEMIEGGELHGWNLLLAQLTLEETSVVYGHVGGKILAQPGWIHADSTTRERIVSAALAFLRGYSPNPDLLEIRNQWQGDDEGPLVALSLLQSQTPERLAPMDRNIWQRLLRPLICIPWDGSRDDLMGWLRTAYKSDSVDGDAVAIARLRLAVQEPLLTDTLDNLITIWNPTLSAAAEAVLRAAETSIAGFANLLKRLIVRDRFSGISLAIRLISDPLLEERRPQVLSALLNFALADAWDTVWSLLNDNETLARAAILGAATSEEIYSQFRQLTVQRLGYVYRRLEELFPAASDPVLDRIVTSRHTVSRIREGALSVLRQIGTFEAVREIEQLTTANPGSLELKYVLEGATQLARAAPWETPTVEAFVELFADSDRRLVRDAQELAAIVLESLDRLQKRVQGPNRPATQYWDESRDEQKPKSETRLADNLRDYLDLVLRQDAIIINREVEIRNLPGRGIGERTDLLIAAASKSRESSKLDVAEVVIECKGCWNDGLFDEMESQLRDRYLRGAGYQHGIYLVGWFLCPLWSHEDSRNRQATQQLGQMSLSDLRKQLEVQAAALSGDVKVSSYVLDLTLG